METITTAWNWCPHCAQLVDADDIHDGSEVQCLGCDRRYRCVAFDDGKLWALEEICPCEGEQDEPGPHIATCPWLEPNHEG